MKKVKGVSVNDSRIQMTKRLRSREIYTLAQTAETLVKLSTKNLLV